MPPIGLRSRVWFWLIPTPLLNSVLAFKWQINNSKNQRYIAAIRTFSTRYWVTIKLHFNHIFKCFPNVSSVRIQKSLVLAQRVEERC